MKVAPRSSSPSRLLVSLAIAAAALSSACDGKSDTSDAAPDAISDAAPDSVSDAASDAASDAVSDSDSASDAASDAAPDTDTSGPTCERSLPAAAPVDPSQTKFALSLYHFNIEYVIGGLEAIEEDGKPILFAGWSDFEGWDNDRVEDWIITQTFAPILGVYERHPSWKVDIELQAYMIEVMAARHPDVLDLLRELAWGGQVELISFHYAAQLFLAFPREDQARSLARVREVFEDHCLPLSGVVFNQEGQAGEGRQRMLVEEGYDIGVFPKNLFRYQYSDAPRWPWYASEGGALIVAPGEVDPTSGVEVAWDFFDDGELRAVPEAVNPYLAALAETDPERVAGLEAQLAAREADGYLLTSISDYVRHLDLMGVEQKPAPPLLDGTWQPTSTTSSIHRWLGGASLVWHDAEEDLRVRSGNARARMHVAATQRLLDAARAKGADVSGLEPRMAAAWDELFHAEVSDATGVNPWRGEVLWCMRLNDKLMADTEAMRAELLALLGTPHASVDLRTGQVMPLADLPQPEPYSETTAPLDVTVRADGRETTVRWLEVSPTVKRMELSVGVADPEATLCEGCDARTVRVEFPRTDDVLRYSPGLIEDEVREYPLSGFDLEVGEVWLPLANGLIGLGDGRYVVKHVRAGHMGVRVSGTDPHVDFVDQTLPEDDTAYWAFDVVEGDASTALDYANRVNIDPVVLY
ncbi:MAG: hypothetical protein H6744_00775 [Deltaproteobacteria bacterium]|nr:hypothetical protein [Deltaproteobacteria bacterium]MCB9785199.1 hypothetical protein [Deltaproteobacteria bacterium]